MGPPSKHLCHMEGSSNILLRQQGLRTKKVYISSSTEARCHGNSRTEAGMPAEPITLLSLPKWHRQVLEYVVPWGNDSLTNNHSSLLWIRRHCTYNQRCPTPPAPTRQIPHLHDFERADAECAQGQNHGLLLLQPIGVSLKLHSAWQCARI